MLLAKQNNHFKSQSCVELQKGIQKEYRQPLSSRKQAEKHFIPFCSQRKLGKLIINSEKATSEHKVSTQNLLDKLNFRNFHKIYKLVTKDENQRYSQLTRNSLQRNLINKQWKMHSVSKLPYSSSSRFKETNKQSHINQVKQLDKFDKMNLQLFKKLNHVKQPINNPELMPMYANFITICELNENIRRQELLKGQKS